MCLHQQSGRAALYAPEQREQHPQAVGGGVGHRNLSADEKGRACHQRGPGISQLRGGYYRAEELCRKSLRNPAPRPQAISAHLVHAGLFSLHTYDSHAGYPDPAGLSVHLYPAGEALVFGRSGRCGKRPLRSWNCVYSSVPAAAHAPHCQRQKPELYGIGRERHQRRDARGPPRRCRPLSGAD
ncbi:hypothetical protein SDC9_195193 [bioreactor metagenome]|uniref:Uncharacterized protein n=1 Tax=bioreactor metagenome TaxID=1076179 RepID=A0A645I900_9ZZZZ